VAKDFIVGQPYTYKTNGKAGKWIIIGVSKYFVTLRNGRNETISLKKVTDGEETYLQPLTSSTEYPEGKRLPQENPKDVSLREVDLLD